MAMRIYNTLTKSKETFTPEVAGQVKIYVCGPTVYDFCHVGHARSVVVFDVVVRYLRAMGQAVTYVRNFTDVDDKIIKRANEVGMPASQLAEKFIAEFHRDMDALNVIRADVEPRVTEHIDDIIDIVNTLIEKKVAYLADGDVFFAVEAFADYGKLSGRKLDDMVAGSRIEVNASKRNPYDFVLWKAAKPGEPSWPSPWGDGRPGWHIECSAMSNRFLGETFDIHGGGKDLIFPHHENEIAQSEAAHGKTFARYWMHNGFVNINNEKMSKSLNNFLMIKDILKTYHPETVRLFLLSSHYRSPIDFSDQNLNESEKALNKIYALVKRFDEEHQIRIDDVAQSAAGPFWQAFCEAMDDDFNTAKGVGILFNLIKEANRLLDGAATSTKADVRQIFSDLKRMGGILGILQQPWQTFFETRTQSQLQEMTISPEAIDALIAERTAARKNKDWKRADEIRDQLQAAGIVLEDKADGTHWKVAT
ncbi:cysteine--tRNA ligase [Desulfosarcina ovata subsp. sediminis]|uniref:Cysteine--tRNA ligase n=1 Tax=Desulfosarcina ovata subsp. sediminis TaxID=885957 RepID=A0A5K7ZDK7_9BACT|nr:cysteine--tRNA ligase [Desulfosarcina ovata]BBO80082.1 cysteine--tRNA ligase [Desulfosarcina ovata subsp. sediminis]